MTKIAKRHKTYGLPYMGSKSAIAEWVVSYLPPAENFYDLFAGGCAITHAALLLKNYQHYIVNDLNPAAPFLFKNAVMGKYHNENRWISREDFDRLKKTDAFVAFCWSFGSNLDSYMYSQEIEPMKRALHYAIFFGDYEPMRKFGYDLSFMARYNNISARYLAYKQYAKSKKVRLDLPSLSTSQRLQSLERLQRLQSLETLTGDYRDVKIKPNSVLYCDIPYEHTGGYVTGEFDHAAFREWAQAQNEPVIISSYQMPSDFIKIASISKAVKMVASDKRIFASECLFVPRVQIEKGIFKYKL